MSGKGHGKNQKLEVGKQNAEDNKFSFSLGLLLVVAVYGSAAPAMALTPSKGALEPGPKITVRVYNYAQVWPDPLALAENHARRILRAAGVETLWLDCPVAAAEWRGNPACQEPRNPTHIFLRILPRSMAARLPFSDITFGIAAMSASGERSSDASVFYHRVDELAAGGPASRPQILGHVMAHEIGHLLLKVIGHSPSGIMRARWDREALRQVARGDLLFTPQETALIRAEVRERVSQPEAPQTTGLASLN